MSCPHHADRIPYLVSDGPLRLTCGHCRDELRPGPAEWHAISRTETSVHRDGHELRTLRVGHWWWALVRRDGDEPGHLVVGSSRTYRGAQRLAGRAAR